MNKKKCATNEDIATNIQTLGEEDTYKYLGLEELKDGRYTNLTVEKIEEEINKETQRTQQCQC